MLGKYLEAAGASLASPRPNQPWDRGKGSVPPPDQAVFYLLRRECGIRISHDQKTKQPMARYNFSTDKSYAAKLIRTAQRPLENDPNLSLQLIRLEFAIYWMTAEKRLLESQGEIACREIVVGKLVPISKDAGLAKYAESLKILPPFNEAANWIGLEDSGRWIELQFGPAESEGGRNPFRKIAAFDPSGWTINEYRYDRNAKWVRIGAAAEAVGVSESTVRRRIDALEAEKGSELVVRTNGRQRKIYLPLFTLLWED